MPAQRWDQVQSLYLEAEGLPAAARADFLDQACGGDAALRAEVEALLTHASETRAATEPPEPPTVPGETENAELPAGTRLGPWRVVRLAGRGGMGEVYEAQRADGAFELRAAVKLLKRGLDTAAIVARFNRERRILARLDHPNIAHVLDAGVAPDGRPFLVMEYVDGLPVTEWVRGRELAAAEVLRIMITVCEAVQAAHAKHIVHRDLKPSNVLVTAQGQVKLLDFGIAKALTEDEDGEATRLGGSGAMTPAYAAPEQLLGLPATPASDVYALGCILYQLLLERLPHRRGGRSTAEIARNLERETVERPSTVLRKERGRMAEPLRLARLKSASQDLDLIVLKALHPETQRRYASAQALAEDLQRLLDHRPVLARPDSVAYRIGRFVRRNRLMVAAAAAVVLALSAGLAAALWQAHVAVLARNDATHRREQADDLINYMLGDLKDRLDEVGRLDVLDSTIGKAMTYVAGGDPRLMDDQALAERITALDRVGEIQLARSQLKDAVATGHAAVDAARELQRRHQDERADRLLASALFGLADAATRAADYPTSEPLLTEGLALSQRLLAQQPADPELVLLVAKYEGAIGSNDDFGPLTKEKDGDLRWHDCIDRLKPQAANPAAKPQLVRQLIYCEMGWTVHLNNSGRFDDARRAALELTDTGQALHQRYVNVAFLQAALLDGLGSAAATLARMGQAEAASRPSALALEIGRQLTALEPGNMDWLHGYANTLMFDIDVRDQLKVWNEALADAEKAEPLFQKVLEHAPDDVSTRLEAMQLHMVWAKVYFHMERKGLAVEQAGLGLKMVRDSDQSTQLLIGGKLPLLARLLAYAPDPRSDAARQAQAQMQQLLEQLSARPDAPRAELDFNWVLFDYLSGHCDEGDRLRDKLIADHNPRVPGLQRFRDQGCGGKGQKVAAKS
jgi:tRNA A-37 threonylcarbamoyl transferase component Bud32